MVVAKRLYHRICSDKSDLATNYDHNCNHGSNGSELMTMANDETKIITKVEEVTIGDSTMMVTKVLWRRRDNGREMWCTPEVRPLASNILHPDQEDQWELAVV